MYCRAALLASVCAAMLVGTAETAPVTWYAGIEGGWSDVIDDSARYQGITPSPVAGKGDFEFDSSWAMLATLGMDIGGGWRMEGEAGYRNNDFDLAVPMIVGTLNRQGSLEELSLMGNWLLDLPLNKSGSFKLSLGFGLGLDYAKMKLDNGFDANEWALAYQGIAGLSYAIDDATDITLNLRHFRVHAPKFDDASSNDMSIRFDEIGTNMLTIGLRRDL
jgi:hypothetical protein